MGPDVDPSVARTGGMSARDTREVAVRAQRQTDAGSRTGPS